MKSFLSRYRILTALVVLVLAWTHTNAPVAFAQSSSSGTVTGTVTDPTGAVVPEATITLLDPSTKQTRTALSNSQGFYVMQNIVPGNYKITAVKTGFSTDEIAVLTVSVGTQTTANFKMAVGAENTTVDVQASNADLQTMNASTGQTVDPAVVDSLPSIGREVTSFATLQPGVTPGGNVAGTTTDQASFALDGGNASSDMDGTANVYTTSYASSTTGGFLAAAPQGVIPMGQDSVEEFKVTTTGQTADFNNSSGSQTQVVTKRGHDKVHGTVYEYYLDNNFNANSWQNNFPNSGTTSYTPKPSYHYSRFGAAAGGPIAPYFLGGKTYLFGNYEGFRWPNAATIERVVPSNNFLQQGQLTFGSATYVQGNAATGGTLTGADPRGLGFSPTLQAFYKQYLPQAPVSNNGNVDNNGKTLAGTFDQSCGALSGPYCDGINLIGYKGNATLPNTTDTYVFRMDHDFGQKWHLMASYREYKFSILNSAQTDVGGALPGDTLGSIVAVTPRPQKPWYLVVGLTTNISSNLTNDFHYSYLRNYWQWKGPGASPSAQGFPNAGGVIEPLGEQQNAVLSPFNVNAQQIRTRIWDGQDNFFSDNLSKLKGDHLIQFGGQYQHNFNYHLRTDNGNSINYTPTYQIGDSGGGGNITYSGKAGTAACSLPGAGLNCVGASVSSQARILDTYYGLVTDTQVANTYTNSNGTLTLNPPATPFSAKSTIPYYNIYLTDTWRVKPNLTVNYGLGYAIEMPPTEAQGSQVLLTDTNGSAIRAQQWLAQRKTAAISGQVYNPYIGFALVHNVASDEQRKYPYDPFYGAFSPHVSFAWNPKFASPSLNKIFGDGSSVIRAGYSRLYGRLNGDVQVLNPILAPGLVLATQCKFNQHGTTAGPGTCNQSGFTDSTVYRFGVDGQNPVTASAAPPATLSQPYRPGLDGPGVAIASPDDPSLRPNDVDTFNFSIQRQINRKMLVEVGYIGRLIHHEYIYLNPNQIPYQLSMGGQSFESAYIALEGALGCTLTASQCANSATPTSVAPQPFFENSITPSYCTGYANCTSAVLNKQTSNLRAQKVYSLWAALDAGTFTFPRSIMGSPTSNATYGSAGQVGSGLTMATAAGYGNYNAAYVSFKSTGFHGITAQENLTYSKALGLGSYTQSSSGVAAQDSFNLHQQYGRQGFDQKYIFNTFIVYDTPWYKSQSGIVGRLAGGWTLSPVLTAGTGQPLNCTTNNSGQSFGGEDGSNITGDGENCIFNSRFTGRAVTHRGVVGGTDPYNVKVGTSVHAGAPSAAVNFFSNPVTVFDNVRPAILGIDNQDSGSGNINNLGYLNLDFSVKKRVVIYEKYSLEFSGIFYNALNHLDFGTPGLSLQSAATWGVTKTQGNSPRQIQMGVRANF